MDKKNAAMHMKIRRRKIAHSSLRAARAVISAVSVITVALLLVRAYGGRFAMSVKVNAALEVYNAAAELFMPQVVYAGDGAAGGLGNDIFAAALPTLSYYNRILWYESLEEASHEMLAVEENSRAADSNQQTEVSDSTNEAVTGETQEAAGVDIIAETEDNGQGVISEDEISEVASMARSGSSSDSGGSGSGISTAASNDVEDAVDVLANLVKSVTVDRDSLSDFDYLKSTFYQVDSTTNVTPELLDVSEFLTRDMTLVKSVDGSPQILIYHTHSQEGYADSVEGDSSTTVVGVGEYLTSLLTEQYGYFVLHHMGEYDVGDRDHAYTNAAPALEELLEEYPSIQVVIDLHRDGVSDSTHLVTEINGKPTAQIMFFNGISHTTALGDISWLPNEYIEGNLAFSFRLQLAAAEYYPGLTRKIYIKGYRYNMHYLPQSLLVEVGAQNNTIEEAMNAMEPLAAILDYVLSGGT